MKDLTIGSPTKAILAMAIPVAAGMIWERTQLPELAQQAHYYS